MIKEITVHPKPTNNIAKIICLIAAFVAACGFVTSFLIDSYRGLVAAFALFTLVTAILIYTKYISPSYYYDVALDSEGTATFVVRQLIGKRQTTLCRVALFDVVSVEYESKEIRKKHLTPKETRKYSYVPTISPAYVCRVNVVNRYERAEILIEVSREFSELLQAYAAEARENYVEEE